MPEPGIPISPLSRRGRFLKWLMWGFFGLLAVVLVLQLCLDVAASQPIVITDGPGALRIAEEVIGRAPRTLIVAAHPDDIEWYMGGTVARLVDAGAEVTVLMATNGEARSGRALSGRELGEARTAEQVEASRRLGVTDVRFLELPDAGLWRSPQLTGRVRDIWQGVAPELVITFDPSLPRLSYLHPDHMSVGRAVGRIAAGLPGEGVEVWYFHTRKPDVAVDTEETLERKVHALTAHSTQMGGNTQGLLSSHSAQGRAIGSLVGIACCEGFRRLPAQLPHQ